jgi:hypothetical protein
LLINEGDKMGETLSSMHVNQMDGTEGHRSDSYFSFLVLGGPQAQKKIWFLLKRVTG